MPLQKSYSDLNYRSRGPNYPRQPNWSRSKSNSAAQVGPTAAKSTKVVVSDATKSKLKQFTFDRNDVLEAPNQNDDDDDTISNTSEKENITDGKTPKSAKTPSNRPSWAELLTVSEKSSEKKEQAVRPTVDTISWSVSVAQDQDRVPLAGSPVWSRKRARSSSPTSSPVPASKTPTAASIRKLARAARSPYADPTTELWDRYALGGRNNTDRINAGTSANSPRGGSSFLTNPLLAQVMVSSSPRPHKSGEANFRRAASCGNNWPKRRRIERTTDGSALAIVDNGCNLTPSKLAKTSIVSEILETVNVEIESKTRWELPSSPSPRKKSTQPIPLLSPQRSGTTARLNNGIASSSDYGDDDFNFDEDTLMELDSTLVPVHNHVETYQEASALSVNVAAPTPPAVVAPAEPPAAEPPTIGAMGFEDDDEDEFGDMDDDVFDQLTASLSDTKLPSPRKHQQPREHYSTTMHATTVAVGEDYGDDDFGDDFGDDFDFNAAELAATQAAAEKAAASQPVRSQEKSRIIQRYLVTKVVPGYYQNARGNDAPEVILVVEVDKTKEIRTIYLREDWVDTPVNVNAYVHVIGTFDCDKCIVDNTQHIVILHPDQLISSTVVADSFSCTRRAVLQDRVRATSEPTAPLVYGSMLHEIFQEALLANNWSRSFLDAAIERNCQKHVEDLYAIKVGIEDAQSHLQSKMGELQSWADAFIASHPKPNAIVSGRNGDKAAMCVTKLLDVEEHVWSPMYGLKGNIDATVEVKMQEGKTQRTLTVPFEVKTGKRENISHQTQTVLYNLLLSDRYDIEVAYGVLYYMETSKTMRIPAIRHELRHMIMQRNRLACHLRDRSVQLPEMKRNENLCGNCYAKTSCFIYHRLADDGDAETSGVGKKFDEVVAHLTPTHKEFFLKWEDLLTKEEKDTQKLKRELWTMLGPEREKLGRCLAGVVIEDGSEKEEKDAAKINRYTYTFLKDQDGRVDPKFSFLDSQLAVGEPIVVSDEQGHFALALGFVMAVRKTRISVAVDRRLHNSRIRQPGFDENTNQVFSGIMEVVPRPAGAVPMRDEKPVRFRLDKDEFKNGMATVRNNLVQTMEGGPFGQHIRRLVVDLVPPRFKNVATQYTISSSGQNSLNTDQKNAIEKVMSAQDYALVLGMPGTGKTTTIAHIIRALVAQGKSVLLTSYTHSAVDNILLKLKGDGFPILRLGAPAKVHPEVQDFVTLAGGDTGAKTFESIHQSWHGSPIVATTCLGISHPLFHERTFDYCIVDEASQITLPICLGPIRMAMRFVLVGDHYQLPPLVQNEEARKGGLDVSLFKLLSDAHPEGVVNLTHQYRMCEDIMTLSNTLIYDGRLKCGTEELKEKMLYVPNMDGLRGHHYGVVQPPLRSSMPLPLSMPEMPCPGPSQNQKGCWLNDLLDPAARVRFINTDPLGQAAKESSKGNRIVNPSEVNIVTSLVLSLLSVGVPPGEIGVMTHYRSQLSQLKHSLGRHLGTAGASSVEMHTADRFQGRDKEVVVLSLVRSNDKGSIGELLKDWRRINVAFTRAKTKLLVVGSRDTLRGDGKGVGKGKGKKDGVGLEEEEVAGGARGGDGASEEMVSSFVQLMEDKKWVYDLPPSALDDHLFEEGMVATGQGSSLSPRRPLRSPRPPTGIATITADSLGGVPAYNSNSIVDGGDDTGGSGGGRGVGTTATATATTKSKRPKKGTLMINQEIGLGKENSRNNANTHNTGNHGHKYQQPRRAGRMGERAVESVLRGKPVLKNVLDEFMG